MRVLAVVLVTWIVAAVAPAAETSEQLFLKAQTAYESGNQEQAEEWLRKSASAGFAEAQYNLGMFYHNGQVVSKDHAEAHAWYLAAAEQGHPKAQVNVAIFYYYGVAVPEDRIAAYMWFSLALAAGVEEARGNLSLIDYELTPEELARAKELAREKQIEIRERMAAGAD